MRSFYSLLFLLVNLLGLSGQTVKIEHSSAYSDPYIAGVVNFCLIQSLDNAAQLPVSIHKLLAQHGAFNVERKFPHAKKPFDSINARGERLADLSCIYKAEFPVSTELLKLIDAFRKLPEIKYAEPHFIPALSYVPNDTRIGEQYSLTKLNAFAAWDLHQGDTNTVIGVTDTGYDPFHPDLSNNIQKNYADPINGLDDDNDGYTDNFMGWDTGNNDSDPTSDGNYHGQHVSGLCSASTDNAIGVAGTGYKCRFIHIKVANSDGVLSGAYEGIVYAADHGCKVINCSWGGTTYSDMNADVIRYAAINMDCAIFCGAGNNNDEVSFYPAMYPYAMAIGSTDNLDNKSSFSNFGYGLDVFAPGDLVVSTWSNGEYLSTGGTSMASPTAAGCAALLRSAFPEWSSQQIGEQLKVTSDKVDNIPFNSPYAGKMGYGRINMFRSLAETGHPSIVLNDATTSDGAENLFLPGDTIRLSGVLINYLSAANDVNLELTALNPNFQILNPSRGMGAMASLQTQNLNTDPFLILVGDAVGFNELITVQLQSNADGFIQNQTFAFPVNADFINVQNNLIKTSIGGNSILGVTGNSFLPGLGFRFRNSENLLYQGGLMLGWNSTHVHDNLRGISGDDADWNTTSRLLEMPVSLPGIEMHSGIMEAQSNDFPVVTGVCVLSAEAIPNDHFVIVEYSINNTSSGVYDQLYAGIFTDWDLIDYSSNKAGYQSTLKLGYVHTAPIDTIYTGVQVLTDQNARHHAIENIPGGVGGVNLADGFSSDEKYFCMSSSQDQAGLTGNGSDIINVVSAGPFTLQPAEEQVVAFALLAGNSLSELTQAAVDARNFYTNTGVPLNNSTTETEWSVFPNPTSEKLTLKRGDGKYTQANVYLADIRGRIVRDQKWTGISSSMNVTELEEGIYILKIESSEGVTQKRIVIRH